MVTGAAAVSAATILPRASLGADWRPTETVRLIVPAAPGGSTDDGTHAGGASARRWGQSAIVENRPRRRHHRHIRGDAPEGRWPYHPVNPGPNAIALSIYRNLSYKADQLQLSPT